MSDIYSEKWKAAKPAKSTGFWYVGTIVRGEIDGGIVSYRDNPAVAHLIAAAPELYEALSDAVDLLNQHMKDIGGCDHSVGICCCDDERRIDAMRAALAKARGEEPQS